MVGHGDDIKEKGLSAENVYDRATSHGGACHRTSTSRGITLIETAIISSCSYSATLLPSQLLPTTERGYSKCFSRS